MHLVLIEVGVLNKVKPLPEGNLFRTASNTPLTS